jgi:RHS repeat-associated protein
MLAYDNDGLLIQYGGFTIEHRGPLGAPSEISNGNMSVTYTYDTYGRPVERTNTVNGQQVYSLKTGYDNAGMIKSRKETVNGVVAESTYTYDANKQLTGVSGGVAESYTYDVNGNRLTGGATYDDQDRLTHLGDVAYQFNVDGFLAERGTDTFEYTAQGELRDVTLPDKKASYTYDGLGRRVGRIVTTGTEEEPVITTEQYLYGNLGNPFQITAMRDNADSLSEYYYDQSNCLFAIKQGLTWYYVATDQQGTPRVITDAAGQVVRVMEYNSYGKLISDSNPDFQLPVGYAGGITDPDTKLVHFGMRDYDPDAGRWTARDPILFNGQQGNLYVYVNNNPVNLRDPYGLFCIGGSAYLGFGGGGQFCVTNEGVSLCAEVGFGIGTSVEVSPFGGLAGNGNEVGIQGGLTFAGIGPSGGITLDNCGSLKFSGGLSVGPVSKSASYDFLEGTWSIDDLAVGGEVKDMNNKVSDSFKPGFGGNLKVYGKSCMQL